MAQLERDDRGSRQAADSDPQPLSTVANGLHGKLEQARAQSEQGNLADAERICAEILRQEPAHFAAWHLLGEIALRTRRVDLAERRFAKAIEVRPDFAEAYCDRGMALRRLKRYEDALASYDRAIALKPDFAMAYNNRCNVMLDLGRSAEALANCERAIALNPGLPLAHYNRGRALQELKRVDEAVESYDQAIKLRPDFGEALWNQSLCLLLMGRFEQGWRQYEWRKRREEPVADRCFPEPLWLGQEDIAGKTLFIWWEQGLGDTLQFCRYARHVEAGGAKVIFSVQQPLRELLKQISPTIEVVGPDDVPAEFDYHCPLLGLPLAFGTTLATIPSPQPYLKADAALRAAWEARLPPKTKPRIGLVWSGRAEHKNDRNRSIALQQLLPMLGGGAEWICLQNEVREKDRAMLCESGRIAVFGDALKDFSETAALLELTDLVIAVDTSVAHLAGAMGKPVWILLPYAPDWRWLLERDDSPWYPSARLFRQQQIGDWAGVISRVGHELRSLTG